MRVSSTTLLLLVLAVLLPATRAAAQDDKALLREGLFARDRNVAVTERPHPEYQPFVQRFGAFSVLPVITGTVEGNDNIYGFSRSPVSDTIFRISPAVTAQSTWSRHQAILFASLNSSIYGSHSGENTTDFNLGGLGRLDASRALGFAGGANYERDTEPRTSSSSPTNAIHPIRYDVAKAFGEATYAAPRRAGG